MSEHTQTIQTYLSTLKAIIDNFPIADLESLLSVIEEARENEKTVFTCGNGGSWATASHMAADFSKNTRMPGKKRLKVIGLGDNVPSLTAYANDEGYERVFAEPIITLMQPGDVLIAISGSGNSPNVLTAVEAAKEIGATTLGLTGFHGGKLAKAVDHALVIPSDSIEMVEDFHMIIDHILVVCLRR
jgi:D-sedoheptulose 7-phosphate isomerase